MAAVTIHPVVKSPVGSSSAGRNDKASSRSQQFKDEMEKRIRDTVGIQDKDSDAIVIAGNATEAGQIIECIVSRKDGNTNKTISYLAERVVGSGTFGVVFQAKYLETGEAVAIKKVLQDRRYKTRELSVMRMLNHPNVVQLKQSFFSTNEKDELYLNLVLEYVPETVYRVLKYHTRMSHFMPTLYVQLYTYQICRALNYIHNVIGVCHRDIKPQFIGQSSHSPA